MRKNDYTSPAIDCLEWNLEGVICGSGNPDSDVLDSDLPGYNPSEGKW